MHNERLLIPFSMIKREELHRNFIDALKRKIPVKAKLVDLLMEILFIEKGAANRRLSGEVPFSFYEAASIAERLDLSLNSLVKTNSAPVDRFELNIIKYTDMSESDYKEWEDYNGLISTTKSDPDSEMLESSNVLPLSIYAGFDSLQKYYLFKYTYLFQGTENRIAFGDLAFPERLSRIYESYFKETKYFAKTIYIWDYLIFQYLVTDIRFFSGINLISENEIRQIKADLFSLLDYMEDIALNGCFKETGNPAFLYISDVNLEADYSCLTFHEKYLSHLRTFILSSVVSIDYLTYAKLREWIFSLKRFSTLITLTGTVYRTDFFTKQRKIISDL